MSVAYRLVQNRVASHDGIFVLTNLRGPASIWSATAHRFVLQFNSKRSSFPVVHRCNAISNESPFNGIRWKDDHCVYTLSQSLRGHTTLWDNGNPMWRFPRRDMGCIMNRLELCDECESHDNFGGIQKRTRLSCLFDLWCWVAQPREGSCPKTL